MEQKTKQKKNDAALAKLFEKLKKNIKLKIVL